MPTVNDFDVARKVIKSVSSDLKNYGINVEIVINEIDFQKSFLENDYNKIEPPTLTTISADQAADIPVGSMVPMDQVTVLLLGIREIEDGKLFDYKKIRGLAMKI